MLFLLWLGFSGGCDQWSFLALLEKAYAEKIPMSQIFDGRVDEAVKVRDCFVSSLQGEMGVVVGYKAALTSKPAQQRFGVNEPVLGLLLESMLLESGARINTRFGAVPMMEGDLLVRVGDESINTANDHQQILTSLDAVIPFLELPDLVYDPSVSLNGAAISAVNAGSRYGVMGEPLLLNNKGIRDNLDQVSVTLVDDKNTVLAKGSTAALLGHPLDAVLWIRNQLAEEGRQLKKGDLLSLGSATRPVPVSGAGSFTLRYEGFPDRDAIEVVIIFQDDP